VAPFDPDSFGPPVAEPVLDSFRQTWARLGRPGRWWTGAQRLAIADCARHAPRRRLGDPHPSLADLDAEHDRDLSPLVRGVIERVATESFRLDRAWFDAVVARFDSAYGPRGEARYAELVALVVQVVPIDHLCRVLGRPLEPFPDAEPGDPSQLWPDDVGDDGAWLPLSPPGMPNVARALGVVPEDNTTWLWQVMALYAGIDEMLHQTWDHRVLSRPQVELVAARTSALNECFY